MDTFYAQKRSGKIALNLTASTFGDGAFLVAQLVKNLPAVQETRVRSLGREDLLEKKMATHSSTIAWNIS